MALASVLSTHQPAQDDPDVPPILVCKIRMGQELKVRCIAKKVHYTLCIPPSNSSTSISTSLSALGYR